MINCDGRDPCVECNHANSLDRNRRCIRLGAQDVICCLDGWKVDYEYHDHLSTSTQSCVALAEAPQVIIRFTHGLGPTEAIFISKTLIERKASSDLFKAPAMPYHPRSTSDIIYCATPFDLDRYLEQHIDDNFERFLDSSPLMVAFTRQFLRTARKNLIRKGAPWLRDALKLIVAYNLTFHDLTICSTDKSTTPANDNSTNPISRDIFSTPTALNAKMKHALAAEWRRFHTETLSKLFKIECAGPLLMLLSGILLITWEEMQYHSQCSKVCDPSRQRLRVMLIPPRLLTKQMLSVWKWSSLPSPV